MNWIGQAVRGDLQVEDYLEYEGIQPKSYTDTYKSTQLHIQLLIYQLLIYQTTYILFNYLYIQVFIY